MKTQDLKEKIQEKLGGIIDWTGEERGEHLESIISIPVYAGDDYNSILARFLLAANDADILDLISVS